jgi:hypothetical protein
MIEDEIQDQFEMKDPGKEGRGGIADGTNRMLQGNDI